ncbi:probable aspartic proteinase GIP2 [Actinidia eriantha]|uniref:probable aspartic proteinase GIP2 n=1 Tax=Actinidia eriantha TaxID=165200 RepID=UPI002585DBD8|nr:probable aspartic proteinase GIP2 [Actinidia eriantha]
MVNLRRWQGETVLSEKAKDDGSTINDENFPTADDVKGDPSVEYFIGVTSILVNKKHVQLNTTFLSIDKKGYGGTKISTVNPNIVPNCSIYEAAAETFGMELKAPNVAKVAPVAPFSDCCSTEFLSYYWLGLGVPDIAFVFGNSMGQIGWWRQKRSDVFIMGWTQQCLAFVDGGLNPRTSIVIGARHLEDNLLQLDVAASKLGFTSTLLQQELGCANFNF